LHQAVMTLNYNYVLVPLCMQQCGADLILKDVFVRAIFVATFKITKNT